MREWVRSAGRVAVVLASLSLSACYSIHGYIPARVDQCPGVCLDTFRAGASRVDLTPIPGIPIGGYSMTGKISRGFWTRIYARTTYMQDADKEPLVLVSTNLMIIPNGLPDRVAELLSEDSTLRHIGREQLILAATENHQSPGGFFTDRFHTSFGSAEAGFDTDLFEFFAHQIRDGIKEAFVAKKPAEIRVIDRVWDAKRGANSHVTKLGKFFVNRSFEAFKLNREAHDLMNDNIADNIPRCVLERFRDNLWRDDLVSERDACLAVDPHVEIIEVREAGGGPRISVSFFLAAHTATLSAQMEIFSGDTFEVAAAMLETPRLRLDHTGTAISECNGIPALPIAAPFNGAQGDVTVWFSTRDRAEVLKYAAMLAGKVCELVGHAATENPLTDTDISFRYVPDQPLSKQKFVDQTTYRQDMDQWTAKYPTPGIAQLGGAEQGRSKGHESGDQEGTRNVKRDWWRFSRNDHGMKKQVLGIMRMSLGELAFVAAPPPNRVPLGVYRIGSLALATLPSEFTTVLGMRLRAGLLAAGNPAPKRVLLVGLANGHVSYVTTREEYDFQEYEGASNVYGPVTGPLLVKALTDLGDQLPGASTQPQAAPYWYTVGTRAYFKMQNVGAPPLLVDDGLGMIVQTIGRGLPERDFPMICWEDYISRLGRGDPVCNRVVPEVTFEHVVKNIAGDILGYEFAGTNMSIDMVTVVARVGPSAEWCAIWLGLATEDDRFVIEPVMEDATLAGRDTVGPRVGKPSYFTIDTGERSQQQRAISSPQQFQCNVLERWLGICAENVCYARSY